MNRSPSKEALRSLLNSSERLSLLSCVSVSLSRSLITSVLLCDAAVTVLCCCHLTAILWGTVHSPTASELSGHNHIDFKRRAQQSRLSFCLSKIQKNTGANKFICYFLERKMAPVPSYISLVQALVRKIKSTSH